MSVKGLKKKQVKAGKQVTLVTNNTKPNNKKQNAKKQNGGNITKIKTLPGKLPKNIYFLSNRNFSIHLFFLVLSPVSLVFVTKLKLSPFQRLV